MAACQRQLDPLLTCLNCKIKAPGSFCDLPVKALHDLEAIKEVTRYVPHALPFMEGDPPRGIHVLCRGRAKLTMTSSTGRTLFLRLIERGEVLGLDTALSSKPYDATAEIMELSQIAFISRPNFVSFLQQHTDACLRIARILSETCHDAYYQIRSTRLAQTSAGKLAGFLLAWSAKGEETEQGIRMTVPLTQEEIAQAIGSSRETVNRLLGSFSMRNLIQVKGANLWIPDPRALANLVDA